MKHLLALVVLTFAIGVVYAVPARPLYEPPEPPKMAPPIVMGGTYWFGKCYEDNFWIVFEKDSTLTYGYGTSQFKNGTWKLDGVNMYFEMNMKYLEFKGTMTNGVIQGESRNVAGGVWDTRLVHDPTKSR